ncbi:TetR/AcrR family transcriptional regulator [Herbiconiux liangxiaofengii]|uniref:TetR/AcrR family transcriptional regulator n=1 Tax=Herbiconiux liangxiaofengii TaxID=3342795 RepID=UPI0035BA49BB
MAQHRDSAREAILTAFQDLLVQTRGSSASLDDVARRAGVTKGGLLYHFGSRRILEDALVDRLEVLSAVDLEKMRTAPGGAAAYYLPLRDYVDSPLDRVTVAVGLLAHDNDRARTAIAELRAASYALLLADLGDPLVARAAILIADGLYYETLTTGAIPDDEVDMIAFIERLKATGPPAGPPV